MILLLLRRLFPSFFTPTMNRYTVLFTCQRGRAGNFRSVLAESPLAAQKLVEETTPTLGAVYEVRDYIGPAGN